jgi:DNA helicase II / ATP-dependent DNA helicase PcrA
VGDEDQSIYSWRGAEIENLLKFPEHFPGTRIVRLEQNYRSRETILKAASAVIAHNRQRLGKELWSERGVGEPITMIIGYNERDEAAQAVDAMVWLRRVGGRPWRDMAVFYRINALSRSFEDQLRQAGIPYRVIGGIKFYDRAEVKDLLAYLRLCVNPRDGVALSRVINKPPRGIGEKTLATLFNEAVRRGDALWDRLVEAGQAEMSGVSRKARAGMANLARLVGEWGEFAANHAPHETLECILRDTGYEESLGQGDDIDTISRQENVGELVTALEQFHEDRPEAALEDFLERVALINAADDVTDEDCVSLMTLHCAKGLEYGAVFLAGMEDPIFPSKRAVMEQQSMEEERRLFYVGITRARDLLFLSRADSRMHYGRSAYNTPSLFLSEVPGELMRTIEDARRTWGEAARSGGSGDTLDRPVLSDQSDKSDKSDLPIHDDGGRFAIGARVRHPRLGEGQVLGASGRGEQRKITVGFDAGFQMEILERFGGLEPAGDGGLPF